MTRKELDKRMESRIGRWLLDLPKQTIGKATFPQTSHVQTLSLDLKEFKSLLRSRSQRLINPSSGLRKNDLN